MVFDNIGKIAVGIAAVMIVLVVGFLIIGQAQDQIVSLDGVTESNSSTFTAGYNATVTLNNALADIPGWVPLIVIASIGAILLSLVALFRR